MKITILLLFGCFLARVTCWEVWKSTCYYFATDKLRYAQSQDVCNGMFAHIVEVETMNEYSEILANMKSGKDYWSGAQKDSNNGVYWFWAVGGGPILNALWKEDDSGKIGNDQCARFSSSDNHRLNDKECTEAFLYICEKSQDIDVKYSCTSGQDIGKNIAQSHETTQASNYNYSSRAAFAVDGDFTTCSITQGGTQAWWQVDLQDHFLIYGVRITNRRDCCESYLRDIELRLYSTNPVTYGIAAVYRICSVFTGPATPSHTQIYINCNQNTTGRWLKIIKTSTTTTMDSILSLCEVEVYGVQCQKERESVTCSLPVVEYNVTSANDRTTNDRYETTSIQTTALMDKSTSEQRATQQHETTSIETTNVYSSSITEDATTDRATHLLTIESNGTTGTTYRNNNASVTLATTHITIRGTSKIDTQTCLCSCVKVRHSNMSEEELIENIDKIVEELKVERKSTDFYKRTLISADDERPSSQRIGGLGITVLLFAFLFFVASDIYNLCVLLYSRFIQDLRK